MRLHALIPSILVAPFVLNSLARGEDAERSIQVGHKTQLFVDDFIVSRTNNVERILGSVTKRNNGKPVFTDGRFYGTVLYDNKRFKLWYRLHEHKGYGYAESKDGIHFDKRSLVTGIPFAGDFNLSVMIDPHETDSKHRFKGSYDAVEMAAGLVHSADGIHWTAYNKGRPVTYRAADTYNFLSWDQDAGLYRLFTRTDYGNGGGPFASTIAKDFEVRGTRTMTCKDLKADPTDWKLVRHWHFNKEGPREYRRRQIYAITDWIRHGVHFALMSVYEWPSDFSEGTTTDHHRRHERDVMNFYIGTSRDGNNWDLKWVYAGQPIVPRGADGTWDKDIVFPPSTVVTHDDKHWLYYGGANERHGDPRVTFQREHAIGVATLGLDRFIGLRAKDNRGIVETKPFRLTGDSLQVNVDASAGEITIEVLDSRGKLIPEFSGNDAQTARNIDELRYQARWNGKRDLSALRGKTIQLRFTLRNASLFAFQVR